MEIEKFIKILNSDFYTGVPDSQIKPLCDWLINNYSLDSKHHIIAANEGNSVAIGAGYHLATGKIPVIYMQNSGEGNIINPVASLLSKDVYAIPEIFIIGWRGEPDTKDEPQHIQQGKITLKLLKDIGIDYFVMTKETSEDELKKTMDKFNKILKRGKSVTFVIKKNALEYNQKNNYSNNNKIKREEIIEHIVKISGNDPIISTTGKTSRELFEIRKKNNQSNKYDFLTVGSMGHSSSIALGIALKKPDKKIWCIDGDGSLLMHMGSMAIIGTNSPKNLIHIVINNGAHESVGGMPTAANKIDIPKIAKACGYKYVKSVDNFGDLDKELNIIKNKNKLCLLEIKAIIGARENLGRPTSTPVENKKNFMNYIKN